MAALPYQPGERLEAQVHPGGDWEEAIMLSLYAGISLGGVQRYCVRLRQRENGAWVGGLDIALPFPDILIIKMKEVWAANHEDLVERGRAAPP